MENLKSCLVVALCVIYLVALSPARAQSIVVDPAAVVRPITPLAFGINMEYYTDVCQYTSQLKASGFKSVRWGGGSSMDTYDWKMNYTVKYKAYGATPFDKWMPWALSCGVIPSDCVMTINYGSGTAESAAAFVTHVESKGFKPVYYEIGNEVYGDWEPDYHTVQHDPATYAAEFAKTQAAIKAVDPNVKCGVPIATDEKAYTAPNNEYGTRIGSEVRYTGWTPCVLTALRNLGVTPDFVVWHAYNYWLTLSDEQLLSGVNKFDGRTFAQEAAAIRTMLGQYLPEAGRVQIANTEWNSNACKVGKQTTNLIDGLYMARSLGDSVQTEIVNNSWFTFVTTNEEIVPSADTSAQDCDPSLLYGWRKFNGQFYGDYGIVQGRSNSPNKGYAYPTFHVASILNKWLVANGDKVVRAVSDTPALSSYAIRHADGTVGLLVVNTSPTATYRTVVTTEGSRFSGGANVLSYGIPQDTADAGPAQSTLAVTDGKFAYSFGPYSVTLVTATRKH